jgi:hypothetical protein
VRELFQQALAAPGCSDTLRDDVEKRLRTLR